MNESKRHHRRIFVAVLMVVGIVLYLYVGLVDYDRREIVGIGNMARSLVPVMQACLDIGGSLRIAYPGGVHSWESVPDRCDAMSNKAICDKAEIIPETYPPFEAYADTKYGEWCLVKVSENRETNHQIGFDFIVTQHLSGGARSVDYGEQFVVCSEQWCSKILTCDRPTCNDMTMARWRQEQSLSTTTNTVRING